MDTTLANRWEDLDRAIDRLHLHSAHDALVLLRACFSALKILHILRYATCACNERLSAHDALVLLRACSSALKILHILRCAPCAGNERLIQFDQLLSKYFFASSLTQTYLTSNGPRPVFL